MMEELLAQRTFEPVVKRPREWMNGPVVLGGMGGSALAAEALSYVLPLRQVIIHRDYGLPAFLPEGALYIAISHSGATEESVSFANEAMKLGLPLAVVASGGTLASFAERAELPLALVPKEGSPRYSLLYMVRALLALLGEEEPLSRIAELRIDEGELREQAEEDAHFILPSVPLFYASGKNALLARIGKIMMNETARTPSFWNVFPEFNHNEMQAFDTDMPEGLMHLFRFILIRDADDDARIVRRMDAFTSLMEERGKTVHAVEIPDSRELALATTWMRFVLASRLLAEGRGIDPDTVPLVEAFKKLL